MLTLKLGGGESLEIRTERVVKVSTTLAMTVNEFYNQQDSFVTNMAAVLGIDTSRIVIVDVSWGMASWAKYNAIYYFHTCYLLDSM